MLKNTPPARIDFNNSDSPQKATIDEIIRFTYPRLRENKPAWYIEFYAFDPLRKVMRRKRIKINRLATKSQRREYAAGLINRLYQQLIRGWNPWIEKEFEVAILFDDAIKRYVENNKKMYSDGIFRKETYISHESKIKKLVAYNQQRSAPITYLYQLDKRFCNDFLDYIHLELKNSPLYRNNCLTFIKSFCSFCVEKGFMNDNPASGIKPFNRKLFQKRRKVIPAPVIQQIGEYLKIHDKHFLLSCYLLYYCYIRPIEQTRLKLQYFSVKECTLTIPAQDSKNRTTQTITIPRKVMMFMLDLGVFNYPPHYYLFSNDILPGEVQIDRRLISIRWSRLKKELNLDKDYTFYSLKDTGITEMLDKKLSNISVRDQARHSSLAITDVYTRHRTKADKAILDLDGAL
ncbi:site-specific integrase [Barnesiella sp. An55]|uniref:tyrosine-type recombinase/integrase n=1 Tax=Barnesiella sp. An55 TaxID=1965646 RepID=UPI000B3A0610|nr:site-specific integrase [Barnesiella sp. An55]OUN70227.1 hypothetical protein B5G10_10525 [Barnesiella sp. An55]